MDTGATETATPLTQQSRKRRREKDAYDRRAKQGSSALKMNTAAIKRLGMPQKKKDAKAYFVETRVPELLAEYPNKAEKELTDIAKKEYGHLTDEKVNKECDDRAFKDKKREIDEMGVWKEKMRRHCLVMGNGEYQRGTLSRIENDANGMEEAMKKLGWYVNKKINVQSAVQMTNEFKEFFDDIQRVRSEKVEVEEVLIYFSGHTAFLTYRNRPAMILYPTNWDPYTFDFQELLDDEAKELSKSIRIVGMIIDGCRAPPEKAKKPKEVCVPPSPMRNGFIAFATQPGTNAYVENPAGNGKGGAVYSVYTEALLHCISENEDINQVFRKTCCKVVEVTDGKQIPWYHEALTKLRYSLHS